MGLELPLAAGHGRKMDLKASSQGDSRSLVRQRISFQLSEEQVHGCQRQ